MAKSLLIRFAGMILALLAAASLLLTGYALVQTWRLKGRVTASVQSGLDVIASTLTTTSSSLTAIDSSLAATSDSLKSLQSAARSESASLHSQAASIESLGTLFSNDLPIALTGAQTAMISAQASAKEVEDTLTVLTSNPAFAATPYQPVVPLSMALAGVADGLGALPSPMRATGEKLSATGSGISDLETSVTRFADSVDALTSRLDQARGSIISYQDEINKLSRRLANLRTGAPKWINGAALAATFLLGWLGILQLAALGRGFRWMARGE